MKILKAFLAFVLFAVSLHATRTYHPHANKIEVTFESGDRVIFSTKQNNVYVTGIKIISRKNKKYSVPESAIDAIVSPRLETLRITFHENNQTSYEEGTFKLFFSHGNRNTEKAMGNLYSEFFFEQGVYIGNLDDWLAYKIEKHKAHQDASRYPDKPGS